MPELTQKELAALTQAKCWIRRFYLEGNHIRLDGLERDGLYELLKPLESLEYKLERFRIAGNVEAV